MEPLLEPFRAEDRGRRSGPLHRGGYRVWQASRESVAKYRDRVADRSAIEWTEATWNPVTGCSNVPRPGEPITAELRQIRRCRQQAKADAAA